MLRPLTLSITALLLAACSGTSGVTDVGAAADLESEASADVTAEPPDYDASTPGDLSAGDESSPPDVPAAEVIGLDASENDAAAGDIPAPDNVEPDLVAQDSAGQPDTLPAKKQFGESCAAPEECESGICHEFGQGDSLCTIECATADDCPEGSQGKKCNRKGVCKP
jgi:hypothetical protein